MVISTTNMKKHFDLIFDLFIFYPRLFHSWNMKFESGYLFDTTAIKDWAIWTIDLIQHLFAS